jgi:hypothetical protein
VLLPVGLTYLTVLINNEELKIKNESRRRRNIFGFIVAPQNNKKFTDRI